GSYLTLRDSVLDGLPARSRIRLAVGGGHPIVLRAAARHADIVGLSGLGRTLPDGHHHEVRWSQADLRPQLQLVRDAAQQASRSPVIEALVQLVRVTDDRAGAVAELSATIPGATAEDVSRTPFVLIGTHEQMAGQMLAQAEELGITSYVVREPAVPDIE